MKSRIAKYSDAELVVMLKEGSEPAFRELYLRFEQKVLLYALKFTRSKEVAEEILQDIFIKLWNYRENIDITQSFNGLVYKIAKNNLLNHLRDEVKHIAVRKEYSLTLETNRSTTEDKIFFDDYIRVANCAIDKLSSKRKSIFTMSRHEGKTYDEIAAALGISRDTVRLQIIRSLKDIKKYMIANADLPGSMFLLTASIYFRVFFQVQ